MDCPLQLWANFMPQIEVTQEYDQINSNVIGTEGEANLRSSNPNTKTEGAKHSASPLDGVNQINKTTQDC